MDHKSLSTALFSTSFPAPLGLMDNPNQDFQKLELLFGFDHS